MNCPVCHAALERVDYEGYAVRQCFSCRGYLLTIEQLTAIRCADEKTIEDLKFEAVNDTRRDTEEAIRCPNCGKPMLKSRVPDPGAFLADRCGRCKLVWLDGGELARFQLTCLQREV